MIRISFFNGLLVTALSAVTFKPTNAIQIAENNNYDYADLFAEIGAYTMTEAKSGAHAYSSASSKAAAAVTSELEAPPKKGKSKDAKDEKKKLEAAKKELEDVKK